MFLIKSPSSGNELFHNETKPKEKKIEFDKCGQIKIYTICTYKNGPSTDHHHQHNNWKINQFE